MPREKTEKQKPKRQDLKTTRKKYTPCVHCFANVDHKVTNTYLGGKRRRVLCGKCGKPFIIYS
jgi:hypothetical protein